MLDFHCHMLPEMDDGSKSVEQSLQMIKMSYEQGVSHIVMSPHFYPEMEKPKDFLHRRNKKVKLLIDNLNDDVIPKLFVGSEVAYYNGISRSSAIDDLCIVGTKYLMVEMPFSQWNDRICDELIYIREYHNIHPIIAHIDRYYNKNVKLLDKMSECGILFQVNAEAFLNFSARRMMNKFLKDDKIQFLGSDSHGVDKRKPNLNVAYDRIVSKFGEEKIDYINSNGRFALKKAVEVQNIL